MFGTKSEDIVPDNLVATVQLHIEGTLPSKSFSAYAALALVVGTTLITASLVFPFVTTGR